MALSSMKIGQHMKRGSELQKISIEIGLSYAQRIDKLPKYIVDNDFLLFSSFHIHKKQVLPTCFKNILAGKLENFQIFLSDFRSDYSIDEKAFGYKQTIAVLQSTDFSFQKFCLTPKKAERFTVKLEHIGQDFVLPRIKAYKKIQSSSHYQLNSKYVLKSQEVHYSQQILSMPFMQYLEDHSSWFIEGSNDSLLIYRRGKKIKPPGIREFIGDVVEIGRLLTVGRGGRPRPTIHL